MCFFCNERCAQKLGFLSEYLAFLLDALGSVFPAPYPDEQVDRGDAGSSLSTTTPECFVRPPPHSSRFFWEEVKSELDLSLT